MPSNLDILCLIAVSMTVYAMLQNDWRRGVVCLAGAALMLVLAGMLVSAGVLA